MPTVQGLGHVQLTVAGFHEITSKEVKRDDNNNNNNKQANQTKQSNKQTIMQSKQTGSRILRRGRVRGGAQGTFQEAGEGTGRTQGPYGICQEGLD